MLKLETNFTWILQKKILYFSLYILLLLCVMFLSTDIS